MNNKKPACAAYSILKYVFLTSRCQCWCWRCSLCVWAWRPWARAQPWLWRWAGSHPASWEMSASDSTSATAAWVRNASQLRASFDWEWAWDKQLFMWALIIFECFLFICYKCQTITWILPHCQLIISKTSANKIKIVKLCAPVFVNGFRLNPATAFFVAFYPFFQIFFLRRWRVECFRE